MQIDTLKKIVNDLDANYSYVAMCKPAEADLLIMFGISLDRWLTAAVRELGGDTSTLIRGNETGLEVALNGVVTRDDESDYFVDFVGDLK